MKTTKNLSLVLLGALLTAQMSVAEVRSLNDFGVRPDAEKAAIRVCLLTM